MQISEIHIVFMLCNIVATYVISKLFNFFLGSKVKNEKIQIVLYLGYYVLSSLCFLLVEIPIVMLSFNILYFVILTLNYDLEIKHRLLTVIAIYSILFIIEMLVAALTGYIHFPLYGGQSYPSLFGQIANQLIGLTIVNILGGRKKREQQQVVLPFLYWFYIIIIPVFSLYYLVLIFHMGNLKKVYIILCICFLLIINCAIIVLYDLIISSMLEKTKTLLLEQQNKFYKQQLQLLQISMKRNNSLRHDLKGHLTTIKIFLKNQNISNAMEYIDKMINIEDVCKYEFSKTGNAVIDSILNLKYQEAQDKEIYMNGKIQVPEELNIDSFDLTIILGNIVNNAIEATYKKENDRQIIIILMYNRGRIILKVENTYNGKINIDKGNIVTSKKDQNNHGIGLQNVKHAVEKYSGTIDINYNKEWFKIYVMLYL